MILTSFFDESFWVGVVGMSLKLCMNLFLITYLSNLRSGSHIFLIYVTKWQVLLCGLCHSISDLKGQGNCYNKTAVVME